MRTESRRITIIDMRHGRETFAVWSILFFMVPLGLAVQLRIFPPIAAIEPGEALGDRLWDIALPAITMILVVVAYMMRMTRAAILGVMASPYIEMARLKGMTQWRVILHHALPNALSPIINVIVLWTRSLKRGTPGPVVAEGSG